jgi:poly(hydroxyalkanoate) depolymerase family esterase
MTGIRTALVTLVSALLITLTGVAFAPLAAAASLVEVTNFGGNPGGMRMHVYVPNAHPARPAVVVAMHGCGGSGPGFYASSEFAALADRYGFIVVYPSAEQQAGFGNCFDTWSDAAKHRGGGSDPVSIVSMVTYVEQHYGGDPNRVFATGSSSGGMMTNEMLALYPDVFRAGAAFMGVPFNCFANAADFPPGSSKCTGGSMNRTPQQWGDAVRQADPGYSGIRPRMQLWHGTADPLVPYSLLQEEIKQWTNVFGLSQTPTSTDSPQSGWDRRRYADSTGTVQVEAYSIQGAGHSLPAAGMAAYAVAFFGLTGSDNPPPGSGSCRVTDAVNAWNTGLTESITVTNTGASAINGWSLVFTLPNGQTITSGWNATYSPSSGQVTARDATQNAMIAPNASITIGFQATHSGDIGKPASFTLNGMSCTAV